MGPSKFPGKPSKLVQKKRVSVVNAKNANLENNTNNQTDGKYQPKYSASDQCDESETSTTATSFGGTAADINKSHDGDSQVRYTLDRYNEYSYR